MRPAWKLVLSVAALSMGCAAESSGSDDDVSGGKADENAACTTEYTEWALLTLKAAIQAQPLTDARVTELEVLARQAPCRGELLGSTAATTWQDLTSVVVYSPYFKQHADASAAFHLLGNPARGDYDAYLANTVPTLETRAAWRVMKAARPLTSSDRFDMQQWLDLYRVHAENVLHPEFDVSLVGYVEGPWTLNAGEAQFLDLLTESRPQQTRAGAFAAWMDEYDEILNKGVGIDSDDDFDPTNPRMGCFLEEQALCGREQFLDRYARLAPQAKDAEDAEQWMWAFSLWVSLADNPGALYQAAYDQQLARVNAVRPMDLRGAGPYRVWLRAVEGVATNAALLADEVSPAKPCIPTGELSAADGHYADFRTSNPELSAAVTSAAAPSACAY